MYHWSPPYPWIAQPKEFEKLLLEQEAARELLLACLSLEEQQHTGWACPEWYIQIHIYIWYIYWHERLIFIGKLVGTHTNPSMGNSNDNITKYEYVNKWFGLSKWNVCRCAKRNTSWNGPLWWKFCWVHRFCSVPKASFLLRNQWAKELSGTREKARGVPAFPQDMGPPNGRKYMGSWGFTKPPISRVMGPLL